MAGTTTSTVIMDSLLLIAAIAMVIATIAAVLFYLQGEQETQRRRIDRTFDFKSENARREGPKSKRENARQDWNTASNFITAVLAAGVPYIALAV
jgi:energy-converting hydrogenase Eha subunit A